MYEKRKAFRRMLADDKAYIVPGVFECIGARATQLAGFEIVNVTGNGLAASLAGLPDLGIVTMSEVLNSCKYIANSIGAPLIADIDTGFGATLNIMRTIQEFEMAGVAAVHIEDQISPKKCAYYGGDHELVSAEHHVNTIKSCVAARQDENFCIIARTDAVVSYGIDEAIRRSNMNLAAGADVAFVVGLKNLGEATRVAKEVKGPLMININDTSDLNRHNPAEFRAAGVKLALYPATIRGTFHKQGLEALLHLREHGNTQGILDRFSSLKEFRELTGLDYYEGLERQFADDAPAESED